MCTQAPRLSSPGGGAWVHIVYAGAGAWVHIMYAGAGAWVHILAPFAPSVTRLTPCILT